MPAHVVVYYVIALALYGQVSYGEVLRCLLEGLEWLGLNVRRLRGTAKSAITQARSRLGKEPLQRLYQEVVDRQTQGAWYRGNPCRRHHDLVRFVALLENGTHVLFATEMGGYGRGESTLAHGVVAELGPEMLCLATGIFSATLCGSGPKKAAREGFYRGPGPGFPRPQARPGPIGDPGGGCAARNRSWWSRSSMVCCWLISRYGV